MLITLLTDFGLADAYVGEMKAVLLSSKKPPNIVDITHQITPFDIRNGAFQLLRSYDFFPEDTFHLAVVDPGVGSDRNCIYVKTERYHFIGPDNGLLIWAIRECERRDKKKAEAYIIPVEKGAGA